MVEISLSGSLRHILRERMLAVIRGLNYEIPRKEILMDLLFIKDNFNYVIDFKTQEGSDS